MIEKFKIRMLGPFKKMRKFVFKPGINIILGKNCSGKTVMVWTINSLMTGNIFWDEIGVNAPERRKWPYSALEWTGGYGVISVRKHENGLDKAHRFVGKFNNFLFSAYGGKDAERVSRDVIEIMEMGDKQRSDTRILILDDILDALSPAGKKRLMDAFRGKKDFQLIATARKLSGEMKGANIIRL